jgi:O-antigen/teichoic acid export membrane protein
LPFDACFRNLPARVRRASLTSLLNALLAAVRFAVSMMTVSLLIRYLGRTAYGLCITITAMAGWLSVTQAGVGQSFRNEVIRLRAVRSADQVSLLFSSAFAFLLAIATGAGAMITASVRFIPWGAVLNYPDFGRDPRYFSLILASLWIVLLSVPLSIVRGVYSAFQQEFRLAGPLLAGLVTSFSLVLVGIHRDCGLVAVVSASLAATPVGLAFGMAFMPKLISFGFSANALDLRCLRALRGSTGWFLLIEIAAIFIFQADIFLVNLILGPARAAAYGLHFQLFFYVQSGAFLFISPYWPVLGEAWRLGEDEWFRTGVRRLTRTSALIAGCGAAALLIAGPLLMPKWSRGQVAWNLPLAVVMSANVLLQAVTGVSATALGSLGVARNPALIVIFQALLNVSACCWLTHMFGAIGCACGSLIAYAVTSGWYVPWHLRRITRTCLTPA